ncbi:MAG: T9SS type A sorting domain-containing protein [Bacteroidales bacterium]|nr:T9SS type A sorting domain-containing protein [Bacteroidales bacterium]
MFPNPANDYVQVNWNGQQACDLYVYNHLGTAIKIISNVTPNSKIDVADLIPGLYILKTKNSNKVQTINLLVE